MSRAEERYRALANDVDSAIYFCNADGVITYFNNRAADLWGRRPDIEESNERFCGSHMLYRLDGSYLPHDRSPMADVLAGKAPGIFDAEVHIQRPDGSRLVVLVNIAPLIDDDGVIVGAISSFREHPLRARPR